MNERQPPRAQYATIPFTTLFTEIEKLSSSLYGRVIRARPHNGAADVCIKISAKNLAASGIVAGGGRCADDVDVELQLLARFRCSCEFPSSATPSERVCQGACDGTGHPNLVYSLPETDILNADITCDFKYVVMPLLGKDLFEEVVNNGPVDNDKARSIVRGVATGLKRMHDLGWINRDVSLENIVFNADGEPVIIDYGAAGQLGVCHPGLTMPGKRSYMAPEVYRGQVNERRNSPALDVYSLGASLFMMLTGTKMYELPDACSDTTYRSLRNVGLQKLIANWDIPAVDANALELIESMVAEDPSARPTLDDVLSSKWMLHAADAAINDVAEEPAPAPVPAPARAMSL